MGRLRGMTPQPHSAPNQNASIPNAQRVHSKQPPRILEQISVAIRMKHYSKPRKGIALWRALKASLAHWQNFSAAGLSFPFHVTIPITTRFGSGVRRTELYPST